MSPGLEINQFITEAGQKALEMFSRDQNKERMMKYTSFKKYSGKKFIVENLGIKKENPV